MGSNLYFYPSILISFLLKPTCIKPWPRNVCYLIAKQKEITAFEPHINICRHKIIPSVKFSILIAFNKLDNDDERYQSNHQNRTNEHHLNGGVGILCNVIKFQYIPPGGPFHLLPILLSRKRIDPLKSQLHQANS